jgi:exodeoxyribonuclease V gamma subunit
MQPFSPRNFGASHDPRLASYSIDYLEGARALASSHNRASRAPLFTAALPPPSIVDPVRVDRFVRFFHNPAHELLKRRLGVDLHEWRRDRSDLEPVELDDLERWRLGSELLKQRIERVEPVRSHELLRAGGGLPLGSLGEVAYETLWNAAEAITAERTRDVAGGTSEVVPIDLDLGPIRVAGHLADALERGLVITTFSKPGAKQLLELWIRHLLLCAVRPGREVTSVLSGRSEQAGLAVSFAFDHVAEPLPILRDLGELWLTGQCEPLLLFPRTSLAFAETFALDHDPEAAMQAARRAFADKLSERDDAVVQRIFGDDDVLDHAYDVFGRPGGTRSFAMLAVRVFGPLLGRRRST